MERATIFDLLVEVAHLDPAIVAFVDVPPIEYDFAPLYGLESSDVRGIDLEIKGGEVSPVDRECVLICVQVITQEEFDDFLIGRNCEQHGVLTHVVNFLSTQRQMAG